MSASAFERIDLSQPSRRRLQADTLCGIPSRIYEPAEVIPMQPVDSNLLPKVFASAFGLPTTRFDQSDATLAGVEPVFKLPLPYTGTNESRVGGSGTCLPSPECTAVAHGTAQESSKLLGELPPHCRPPSVVAEAAPAETADGKPPLHKPRVVWTEELHQRFLRAIEAAGSEEAAVPTVILRLMNVSGLSRDNVASHLQKHRLGLKRTRSRKRPGAGDGLTGSAAAKHKRSKRSAPPAADGVRSSEAAAAIGSDDAAAAQAREQGCNEREGSNPNANEGSCGRSGSGGGGGGNNAYNASGSDDGAGAGSDNRNSCIETAAQSHGLAAARAAQPSNPQPQPPAQPSDARAFVSGHANGSGQGSNTDGKGTGTDVRASTGGMSSPGSGLGSGTAARDAGHSQPGPDRGRQGSDSGPSESPVELAARLEQQAA